jgi:hypothetical protein
MMPEVASFSIRYYIFSNAILVLIQPLQITEKLVGRIDPEWNSPFHGQFQGFLAKILSTRSVQSDFKFIKVFFVQNYMLQLD